MHETTLIPFFLSSFAHVERDSTGTSFGRERLVADRRIQGIHPRTRTYSIMGLLVEPGSGRRPHLVGRRRLVLRRHVGRRVYYIVRTRSWGFLGLRSWVKPALVGHGLAAVAEVYWCRHRLAVRLACIGFHSAAALPLPRAMSDTPWRAAMRDSSRSSAIRAYQESADADLAPLPALEMEAARRGPAPPDTCLGYMHCSLPATGPAPPAAALVPVGPPGERRAVVRRAD